jgi:hypothetical protein
VLAKHGVDAVAVGDADWRDLRHTVGLATEWSADALVVDSYDAPADRLAGIGVRVVAVIDDLGDRPLPVTIVVNGAAQAQDLRYRVRPDTTLCLGPEYVLLRAEFADEPTRDIQPRIRRALVTVGGADQTLLTPSLIAWAREALDGAALDVVVGPFWSTEARGATERAAGRGRDVILHEDPEGNPTPDALVRCRIEWRRTDGVRAGRHRDSSRGNPTRGESDRESAGAVRPGRTALGG